MRPKLSWSIDDEEESEEMKTVATEYDELWSLDGKKNQEQPTMKNRKKIPPRPEKDVMLFIEHYSRELTDWQRDIMTMIREEMLYFWPQLETKIMNEGWASYRKGVYIKIGKSLVLVVFFICLALLKNNVDF